MRTFKTLLWLLAISVLLIQCKKDENDNTGNNQNNNNNNTGNTLDPQIKAVTSGLQQNSLFDLDISGDGQFIVLVTSVSLTAADTDNFTDVYRIDRTTNTATLISTNLVSNAFSASISNDGNRILYTASQLASTPDNPTAIYLWQNGAISVIQEGQQDPFFPTPIKSPKVAFTNVLSPNGNVISASIDLNHIIFDVGAQQFTTIGNGQPYDFSTDGRFHTWILVDVLTPSKSPAVWRYDRVTGNNIPITNDTKYSGEPSINGDGSLVVFESELGTLTGATDNNGLQDIFLFDANIPKYTRLTPADANANSSFPDISADGRVIAFASGANNLGLPDNNLFSDIIVQVDGQQFNITGTADNQSSLPRLSADGRFVAFVSEATNLPNGTSVPNVYIAGPLR